MKLSLCIAAFNEEKNIHYPLDSAYDIADEVVIVDGGSTDRTVELAKSYGSKIRIITVSNPPMFHINKQKALDEARGEWILQLDADEALSDELKKEIKSLLAGPVSSFPPVNARPATKPPSLRVVGSPSFRVTRQDRVSELEVKKVVVYQIPRKNFFLTRFLMKGGQYPDYTIRLYRNGYARFPCKSVHENVEIKGGIGYLEHSILHYADPDFSRYLKRWDRYTTLDVDILIKEQKKPGFFSYFFIKPTAWFFTTYFRHKGFMDGFPGFVFALFSSLRFWVVYIKWWKKKSKKD